MWPGERGRAGIVRSASGWTAGIGLATTASGVGSGRPPLPPARPPGLSPQDLSMSADASPPPGEAPASVQTPQPRHIRLTSHAGGFGALPIVWGAATARERGPVVGTTTNRAHRNVI